ncbi:MAG TPA: hypothetical protein VN963_06230, partial [bacterium]|nr:hypothetical protein [bacterium]
GNALFLGISIAGSNEEVEVPFILGPTEAALKAMEVAGEATGNGILACAAGGVGAFEGGWDVGEAENAVPSNDQSPPFQDPYAGNNPEINPNPNGNGPGTGGSI